MATLTVYEKPTCSTCVELRALLRERGVEFASIDYHARGIEEQELHELLRKMDAGPRAVLRAREPLVEELGLEDPRVGDDELIAHMSEHPALVQRPIVVLGQRALLARPVERVLELLSPVARRLRLHRDGVDLACLDFGGSGPPVLLLHGLAGYAGEWAETASWLVRRHRALALDQRGHGHSTRAPDDVSREAHVADVAFVIERLALAPVVLVGQSLGGHLAFLLAARRPDLVRALVVAEASPDADPRGVGAKRVRSWLEGWPVPFPSREEAVAFFGGPSLYAHAWSAGLQRREEGWWPRFDVEVMERTLREGTRRDHWSEWERIACPALVVRAGEGYNSAEDLQAMAARLPGARFRDIPGAGHDLHLDRPVEWRDALEGFLAELRGA